MQVRTPHRFADEEPDGPDSGVNVVMAREVTKQAMGDRLALGDGPCRRATAETAGRAGERQVGGEATGEGGSDAGSSGANLVMLLLCLVRARCGCRWSGAEGPDQKGQTRTSAWEVAGDWLSTNRGSGEQAERGRKGLRRVS